MLKKEAGGKCSKCNNNNIRILQFHHKDPKQKDFNISNFYNNKDINILRKEISKCILLCPNCHAELHLSDKQKLIDYYE